MDRLQYCQIKGTTAVLGFVHFHSRSDRRQVPPGLLPGGLSDRVLPTARHPVPLSRLQSALKNVEIAEFFHLDHLSHFIYHFVHIAKFIKFNIIKLIALKMVFLYNKIHWVHNCDRSIVGWHH